MVNQIETINCGIFPYLIKTSKNPPIFIKQSTIAEIITDKNGTIIFMNSSAEILTASKQENAIGKNLTQVFTVLDRKMNTFEGHSVNSAIKKALKKDVFVALPAYALVTKKRTRTLIRSCIAPVRGFTGDIVGTVLIFHAIPEQSYEK